MRPPPTPRSVPTRGALPAGTHVVLAGDEALLEAQEGNVADEVVPHGSAARGTLSSGVLRGWDLNWLERGSRLCRGGRWGGGGKRGQGACREGSASSFVFWDSWGSRGGMWVATRTQVCKDTGTCPPHGL